MEPLYNDFLFVAKALNKSLDITPVLYGSLGLQIVSGIEFHPQDIDILVPFEYINEKWDDLKTVAEELGYKLVDLQEREFEKNGLKIAFAFVEDLFPFAQVDYTSLKVVNKEGIKYKTLSLEDYLKVYSKSVNDGYRCTKNNSKDIEKIEKLKEILTLIEP